MVYQSVGHWAALLAASKAYYLADWKVCCWAAQMAAAMVAPKDVPREYMLVGYSAARMVERLAAH